MALFLPLRIVLIYFLLFLAMPVFAGQAEGIGYLASQAHQEGHYASESDISTPYQSTAETLSTLHALSETQQPGFAPGLQFLQNEQFQGTEYLSRRIIAQVEQGQPDSDGVNQLLLHQNRDGGFGELAGFNSTVLDTALALKALVASGQSTSQFAGFAISFLQANQHQTGYFSLPDNEASVYVTALVSQAFQEFQYIYQVSSNITSANDYLLTQIRADGSAGEIFETAVVLASLAPVTVDSTQYQPLVDHLEANQQTNGAWADDVFTTALALQALYIQQTITPAPVDQAILSGSVTDGADNNPLNNVIVTITTQDNQSLSTITDSEGRYLINSIPAGSISIHYASSDYNPVDVTATVAAGQNFTYNAQLYADPIANPIRLMGQVIDNATTLPLTNVTIQVLDSTFSAQSDSQGGFEILNIPAGTITAKIIKQGYLTQVFSISASAGGVVDLGIINLAPGTVSGTEASISGIMTDAVTGEPLRGVLISTSGADTQSIFTSLDGRFLLNNISPGNVVLTASLEGYQNSVGNALLEAGTNLQFNAALVKTSSPALATIQGLVIDGETQQPILGVHVITNSGQTTDTDNNGRFYLAGIASGTGSFEFSATGYNSVNYSINVNSGGSINLNVSLVKDLPITGNNPPVINSIGPVNAAVGQIYEYQPQAIDPEADELIFGLSDNPSGMEIDTATGFIRWIPTSTQAGEQLYTLVVSDNKGAFTQQVVTVTVAKNTDPSYVITDVQTLNSLTVDALIPNNYVLGSYVEGGRSGTWRATSAQGCGFTFVGGGTDAASITAAANELDFWSMGSGEGSDAIWNLGESLSTVSVLPLIDHGPFPQEGIEYTVWGSNNADATFPGDWTLATLVTIYSQGWADNAAACGGGVNIDDYAGLYTFGLNKFQYIRLKADNSITIFDTPEHTTYNGTEGDNSSLPGWQSSESEIDGVVGMLCETPPQADAGADILGVTRDSIVFDGTGSQGNIITYGWDLDNDSEIDLIGESPAHVFNAGFDGDVSLLVVDDKGCVGADTVHVTIGLDFPKPDLVVSMIDPANVATNLQTLSVSGGVDLTITNQGNAPAIQAAEITVFEDRNSNGQFDLDIDNILGVQTMPSGLAKDDELIMTIAVNGMSLFRDSPIIAMVDSNQQINESKEDNNLASVADSCGFTPTSLGDFDFIEKWYMPGDVYGPVNIGQLSDDNSDGLINENDIPDIIFTSSIGGGKGNLVALNGNSGQVIWKNTSTIVTGYGSPAIGDIDGDGMIEIIIPNIDRLKLHAFEHDGTLKWTANTGPVLTSTPRDAVALADIDHDGDVEIIHGRRAFDHLGNLLWEGSGDHGGDLSYGTLPVIVDLDNQDDMEIIAGRTAYRSDGSILWQRTDLSSAGGFTAIGNFNQDENPEIVLVAGGKVYLLDNQGQTIWGPVSLPGGGTGGAPTVGDFDGDGEPEIGIAGARNYVVLETNGSVKWTSPTQDASSHRTGSSLFDFNLDGKVEVVYADELNLRVYDGSTGTIVKQHRLGSGTTLEYPVIADIDGDGRAEIVVGSNDSRFSSRRGLLAFEDVSDNWAPTRSIWNQHSYHITNINDDGTVPQFEQPSWLSHNSYRLNTFADRDPTLLADITASVLTIHDNGNNQPASISVRIGNAGAGDLSSEIGIAFYQGDPANNGVLLGIVPMNNLAKGAYQDIELTNVSTLSGIADIYVIADYDNRLPECNEANNQVVLPVLPQSSTGQIMVATNQLVYGPNTAVELQASITNTSGVPGEFNATLLVEDAQGIVVQSYTTHLIGPLDSGVNSSLTEHWQTAQLQAGSYNLKGLLYNLSGDVIHQASSSFEIRHTVNGDLLAALRTTTDKPVYNTNDVAQLFNLAQNLAINEIIEDASIQLTVSNPSGTIVYTETVDAGSLVSGALRDFTSAYNFSQALEGTYTVTGELLNKAGESLATNQAQFEVQANLQQLLVGTVEVQLQTLDRGQLQVCTDTVSNNGTEDLTAQPLRQLVVNVTNEQIMTTTDVQVDLAKNTTQTLIRDIPTQGLEAGIYACIIQMQINGEWVSLANSTFTVTLPPIDIDSNLSSITNGRLLVLLDGDSNHGSGCDEDKHKNKYHHESECENDDDDHHHHHYHHHSHNASNGPSLAQQQSYLETLLTENHWSYTLVTDEDAFTREFRSGTYTVYGIFSAKQKLSTQVQQELREAIFRGEGLLVAGGHDHRNKKLDTTLGVKFKGKLRHVDGIDVFPTTFPLNGMSEWTFDEKPLKVTSEGAEVIAYYLCEEQRIAATHYNYGEGKSFFAGFDLLAQASQTNADPLWGELLLAALQDVEPQTTDAFAGSPAAIRLNLTNRGIATPGQAIITIPENTLILDSGLAQQESSSLRWTFDLEKEETEVLDFWLQLPSLTDNLDITGLIQVGITPDLSDFTTVELTLPINTAPTLLDVLAMPEIQAKPFKKIRKYIEKAQRRIDKGRYDKALKYAIKASNRFDKVAGQDADAIRLKLDKAIRKIAQQL